jgi:hypothetical protein
MRFLNIPINYRRSIAILSALAVAAVGMAQGLGLPEPNAARMRADLEFLCGADLTGRETGTAGAEKAAAYVAQTMQEAGALPLRIGGFGGVRGAHRPRSRAGDGQRRRGPFRASA